MIPQVNKVTADRLHKVKLHRSMNAGLAVKTIIENCLRQIQDNKRAMQLRDNPEHIRQMHISLRRLMSALGLFKDIAPLPTKLQVDLRSLSTKLGVARNWRVLSCSSLTKIEALAPDELRVSALRQIALDITNKEENLVYDAVSKNGFSRLMSALLHWLEKVQLSGSENSQTKWKWDKKIPRVAKRILLDQQWHLIKIGDHLLKQGKNSNPLERHKFRIAVKRLRYSCMFFQEFFPKKEMNKYLASLSALQENLGISNDAAVADRLLCDLIQDSRDQVASGNFVRGYLLSHLVLHQHNLRPLWKYHQDVKFPNLKTKHD